MANGFNTTGVPSSDFLTLGRGRLYGAFLDANEKPIAWRDLGNCPSLSATLAVETLKHQSSRQGTRVTDKEIIVSQEVSLSMTLDHIEFDNLALFFGAEKSVSTSPVSGTLTNRTFITSLDGDEYVKGKWFDILDGSGERIYNLLTEGSGLGAGAFVVEQAALATFSGATPLTVAGSDLLYDKVMGRFFVTHNGTVSATLSGNRWLRYRSAATINTPIEMQELRLFQSSSQSIALKFIAENPANGDVQTEYVFHKVTLKGDGDYNFISDEFSTIPLTGVAETSELADPDSPICTVRTYEDAGV